MTDAISTGLAVLAILGQIFLALTLLIALAAIFAEPARTLLREIRDTLLGGELWAAWGIALIATLGSLYFSEIADFVPCRLCWFQRIAMYPLAVLLFLIAQRRDLRNGFAYAIAFPAVGLGISLYHVYIEHHPEAESASCRAGIPCSTKWIEKFGYITIPVLAGTAFALIIVLLAFARSRRLPAHSPTTA